MTAEEVAGAFHKTIRKPRRDVAVFLPTEVGMHTVTRGIVGVGLDGGGAALERLAELYTVLAFDPGGTTGWAVLGIEWEAMQSEEYKLLDNIAFWSAGEFVGAETAQADAMVELAEAWDTADIVVEDFVLRQMRKDRELLSPVRITAMFRFGMRYAGAAYSIKNPRDFDVQQPALAMTSMTDERLKAFGFWNSTVNQPHARDAIRHAVTWARRMKEWTIKDLKLAAEKEAKRLAAAAADVSAEAAEAESA